MLDVVNADVRREPAQDTRQVIVGTALQRGLVKTPGLITGPGRALELVLNIEQPDTDRRSQNHDRQVHQQEGPKPTSQIIPTTRIAMAEFVPIVLSQGAQPLRIIPIGNRCRKINK